MAKAKKKTINKVSTHKSTKAKNPTIISKEKIDLAVSNQKLSEQLKLSDSYISLILGAVVVIAVSVIFFIFIKESRKPTPQPQALNESISPVLSKTPEKTYVTNENETLWDVAVKFYGDGFRYVEIVGANKLENPDYVPPGTKLIIPNAQ